MLTISQAEIEMNQRGKEVERFIAEVNPELLDQFYVYQNEAIQGRKFLDSSLATLENRAEVLEVGSGILALSVQLASEGFRITCVEPTGEGFSSINELMRAFLKQSRVEGIELDLIERPIEICDFEKKFDLIFSINVMEHLNDPYIVLSRLAQNLKPNGTYRFLCPNYDFPYEPHFSKFLIRRKSGAFYLQQSRAQSVRFSQKESQELFNSLNFITTKKVRRAITTQGLNSTLNTGIIHELVERAFHDPELTRRHKGMFFILKVTRLLSLESLVKWWPQNYQPIMDVSVSRPKKTMGTNNYI